MYNLGLYVYIWKTEDVNVQVASTHKINAFLFITDKVRYNLISV